METIPKSGFYLPNKIARITLLTLEEVMGKNGLNAILNMANLSDLIDQYPADNLERLFDFADFSALHGALQEMYGMRSSRGLAIRAGRAVFANGLRHIGALAGIRDPEFQALPLATRLRIGLPALVRVFAQNSDLLSRAEDQENVLIYSVQRCPVCWGRRTDEPACYLMLGLLQEGVKWISGGSELQVVQQAARSAGAPTCDFFIDKLPPA